MRYTFGYKVKTITKWLILIFALALLMLIVYERSKFSIAPKRMTEVIAGIELPETARFIEHVGDRNNLYYRWKIPYDEIENLGLPDDRDPGFRLPMAWTPYDGSFFGSLTKDQVSDDAEALYYRTDFWSVALLRSRSEGTLIVGGIYTN